MIGHRWINTEALTMGITRYYDFLRVFLMYFPVDLLRNKFDSTSGIYIVGEEREINKVSELLIETITKIELTVSNFKIDYYTKMHGSEQIANFKGKVIKGVIDTLMENWEKKKLQRQFTFIDYNRQLRQEYIDQIISLRILKKFKPLKKVIHPGN